MKPWPEDAVMVLAAIAEEFAVPGVGRGIVANCRDCGRRVEASSQGITVALKIGAELRRPVMFFCPGCAVGYDRETITLMRDLREEPEPAAAPLTAAQHNAFPKGRW